MTTETLTPELPSSSRPAKTRKKSSEATIEKTPLKLSMPQGVREKKIAWRYVIGISTIHFVALSAFVPWFFSWTGLILALVGTHVFGSGINIGYHRLLTHRSFKCPLFVERFFVFLALCCLEDAPATWVATHRVHHKDSDEEPDPHSPWVNFWWSHVGWLFYENRDITNGNTFDRFARDVLKDPFYMWLQRGQNSVVVYVLHAVAFFVVGFGVGWAWGGDLLSGLQLAMSWLVWGVFVRTVMVWHITWSVNSLSHLFGYRNFETREESRNNWLVATIAAGEGWHNNHHHDPTAASNGNRWWEIDLSYLTIKGMQMVGLAWDVIPRRIDNHKHSA